MRLTAEEVLRMKVKIKHRHVVSLKSSSKMKSEKVVTIIELKLVTHMFHCHCRLSA